MMLVWLFPVNCARTSCGFAKASIKQTIVVLAMVFAKCVFTPESATRGIRMGQKVFGNLRNVTDTNPVKRLRTAGHGHGYHLSVTSDCRAVVRPRDEGKIGRDFRLINKTRQRRELKLIRC